MIALRKNYSGNINSSSPSVFTGKVITFFFLKIPLFKIVIQKTRYPLLNRDRENNP